MALLQPKLSLKVAQRQILTPGLMQMVSVLALNKLELKEMINAEITENPILEEIEENVPLLDEVAAQEIEHDRAVELRATENEPEKKTDPFEEIDFGSYFQDYLDPGFRTPNSFEITEAPSLENYLSSPGTLTDHIFWQLGSLNLLPAIRDAAEYIIGNLNEDGYLRATDEELLDGYLREQLSTDSSDVNGHHAIADLPPAMLERARAHLAAGLAIVRQLDPVGIGTRDLRECLMVQLAAQRREAVLALERRQRATGEEFVDSGNDDVFATAMHIVGNSLVLLQKKDMRELTRSCGRSTEQVNAAVELIRTLDPRPGQRYNAGETRLIEPDVAFVKRDDAYVVVMNEEDMPTLRLSGTYRQMMRQQGTEKEVRDYVKERYKSAIQLLRNIEQRKNTIVRTCESIVRRQSEFL